ncbi:hypothetical protein [Fluviibacterium sp. S390]|uniref:hypothetical protein n=1 Tax=Fluviibacterium sp. S390 TaxID=3415139 RepID=UPI003C7BDE36
MSNDLSTIRAISEPMMRAIAKINTAPAYWMMLIMGIVLTQFLWLDFAIVYETTSAFYRDERGQLTGYFALLCGVITLATVLAPTWAFHRLLDLLPEHIWNRFFLILALLAIMVVLAQPAIMALQAVMSGSEESLDLAPTEGGNTILLFVILQVVRTPIFVMAMIAAAVGLHTIGSAIEGLRHLNHLKAEVAKARESIDLLTDGMAQSETLQSRMDDRDRNHSMEYAAAISRIVYQDAENIENYVHGEFLLGASNGWMHDLNELLSEEDWQVPEKVLRIAKEQCPQRLNFDGLPNDGRTLPEEAKLILLEYVGWLRENFQFNALVKEISQ